MGCAGVYRPQSGTCSCTTCSEEIGPPEPEHSEDFGVRWHQGRDIQPGWLPRKRAKERTCTDTITGPNHRDVSGGCFGRLLVGAMEGLGSQQSSECRVGVGGGGGSAHTIGLNGMAGLAAGGLPMAAGS